MSFWRVIKLYNLTKQKQHENPKQTIFDRRHGIIINADGPA
jgi:hypothetical protein